LDLPGGDWPPVNARLFFKSIIRGEAARPFLQFSCVNGRGRESRGPAGAERQGSARVDS